MSKSATKAKIVGDPRTEYLPLVSRLDIPPVEILEQHVSLVALEAPYISLVQDKTSKLTAPLEEEYAQQRLFDQLCSIQSGLENHKHTRNIPFKEIDQIN